MNIAKFLGTVFFFKEYLRWLRLHIVQITRSNSNLFELQKVQITRVFSLTRWAVLMEHIVFAVV